jgi:hypothetical protein
MRSTPRIRIGVLELISIKASAIAWRYVPGWSAQGQGAELSRRFAACHDGLMCHAGISTEVFGVVLRLHTVSHHDVRSWAHAVMAMCLLSNPKRTSTRRKGLNAFAIFPLQKIQFLE